MRLIRRYILPGVLILLLCLAFLPIWPPSPPIYRVDGRDDTTIAENVDAYLRSAEKYLGFSGAVLVISGGQRIIRRAYGLASDLNGIANTTETVYLLESVSKHITGFVAVRLEHEGILSRHDPVSKWIPELADLPVGQATIFELTDNTSGLYHTQDHTSILLTGAFSSHRFTNDEVIDVIRDVRIDRTTPRSYRYSDFGFTILSLIAERAVGLSWSEVLEHHVFGPFGMTDSGFMNLEAPPANLAEGHVVMSSLLSDAVWRLPTPRWNPSIILGAGGAYSTLDDMERWWAGLGDLKTQFPELIDAYIRPNEHRYSSGLNLGAHRHWHSGYAPGQQAFIAMNLDRGDLLVLFSNASVFTRINQHTARNLLAIVWGQSHEMLGNPP